MSSQFWGRHIEPTLLKFGRLIHFRNRLSECADKKNAIDSVKLGCGERKGAPKLVPGSIKINEITRSALPCE